MMINNMFDILTIIRWETHNVWCYCPFHEDKERPNLSISLHPDYLGRWKCWACNRDGMLSKKQIARLGLTKSNAYSSPSFEARRYQSTRWLRYVNDCHQNLRRYPLLSFGLAKQLNVAELSLKDFRIGWNGAAYTIPMYSFNKHHDREMGISGVIRRFSDGSKKAVYGSNLGWILSYTRRDQEETLYICEGFTDALVLHDMGLMVMARPNCHYITRVQNVIEQFVDDEDEEYINIIIVPDNDKVGRAGGIKLCDNLCYKYNSRIFKFSGAKDIREYVGIKGKDYVNKELTQFAYSF